MRILLVEDSPDSQLVVSKALGKDHDVVVAPTLMQARSALAAGHFDLLLLDVELPDGEGFKFCADIRSQMDDQMPPVVFLTGRTELADRLMGLAIGADDYLVKPISPAELRARVMARQRASERVASATGPAQLNGDIKLDATSARAWIIRSGQETPMELTPAEFKILGFFLRNQEQTFSRKQLLDAIWGKEVHITERTIDSHVSNLRKKLVSRCFSLKPVRSMGYMLTRIQPTATA